MQLAKRMSMTVAVVAAMFVIHSPGAMADGFSADAAGNLAADARTHHRGPDASRRSAASAKPSKTVYLPKKQYEKRVDDWQSRVDRVIAANQAASAANADCLHSGFADCTLNQTALPDRPDVGLAGDRDATPAVSPQTIAYVAVARIHLAAPTPVVGPDPDLNRWHMAVVGYPLWLSVAGDTGPQTSTDRVFDATVSLRATLQEVTFTMGDGHNVTCTDVSRRWTPGTEPAAASPTCGHTYTDPAPGGTYTVTAHARWSVAWTVNGVSGVLPYDREASVQLPVGELQVLVR